MTIHPEQVRYQFGVPVAAEVLARPMRIIAPVFRDVGQSNDGMTDAVEEVAGAAMRRIAMSEGHMKSLPPGSTKAIATCQREIARVKRLQRTVLLLRAMMDGPITRMAGMEATGVLNGSSWKDFERSAWDMGLIEPQTDKKPVLLGITDAGRAFLRFSEGA